MTDRIVTATDLIHALWRSAPLGTIWTTPSRTTHWFKISGIDDHAAPIDRLAGHIERLGARADGAVYFGVHPCTSIPTTSSDGKPAKASAVRSRVEYIHHIAALYAEIDCKDRGVSATSLAQELQALRLPPSCIVDSGGGVHAYWLLDEPLVIADNVEARTRAITAQRAWVMFVGGDDGAKDLARVLRVPGTWNHKYEPRRQVRIVDGNGRRYRLHDLETAAGVVSTPVLPIRPPLKNAASDARKLTYGESGMTAEVNALSAAPEGTRNDQLNKTAFALGQLHADGCIADLAQWLRIIETTASMIGLDAEEIQRTIRSGITDGQSKPRNKDWDAERTERRAADKAVSSPGSTPAVRPGASGDVTEPQTYVEPRKGITFAELQKKHFDPLRWVVEDIAPEGAIVIAAKPKAKKSWLALNLSVSIANGTRALGKLQVRQGDVLYLDLEGNQRRIKARLAAMLAAEGNTWPANVELHTEWDRDDMAIGQIRAWLERTPSASAVVVDLLHEIRRSMKTNEDRYAYDRDMLVKINKLAEEFHVAIFVIHHTRKMKGDDVFEEISGTLGLTGAASTLWVLSKAQDGTTTLNVQGRDLVRDDPLALQWSNEYCAFSIAGTAAEAAMDDTRRQIIDCMADGELWTQKAIIEETGLTQNVVNKRLADLVATGTIEKGAYGKYRLSTQTTRTTRTTDQVDGIEKPNAKLSGNLSNRTTDVYNRTTDDVPPDLSDLSDLSNLSDLSDLSGDIDQTSTSDDIVEAGEPTPEVVSDVVDAPVVAPGLSWYMRDAEPGATDMVIVNTYMSQPIGERRFIAVSNWGTDQAGVAHGTDPEGYTDEWRARRVARDGNRAWPKQGVITL